MDRLLTVRELAEYFRVTPTCVYRWLQNSEIPVIRFGKRCIRFRESDVQKLVDLHANGNVTSHGDPVLKALGKLSKKSRV